MRTKIAALGLSVIALFCRLPLNAQNSDAWNLSRNSSPSSSTCFWTQSGPRARAQCVTLSTILLGVAPSTRNIHCTSPLLCDGAGSMDLTVDRTLSIAMPEIYAALPPYNAVCNGVADDTSAIQAALDVSGGHTVHLPSGTCKISAALNMNHLGLWLKGNGWGATTISTSSATLDVIRLGSFTTSGYNKCGGVSDLAITSSVTRTAGYAISIDGCEDAELRTMRITTTGGHGIALGPLGSGHLATLVYAHSLDVEINGAYNAISVLSPTAGGYFTDLWLRGTSTAGSIGIYLPYGGGDTWANIESVLFDIGVKIAPATGNSVVWETFSNFFADTNNSYGFYFTGSAGGTIGGISCVACWASTNGASGSGQGIFLESAGSGYNFVAPRVVNNGSHGIQIKGTSDVTISGGFITGNSNSSSGAADGININTSSSGVKIQGNRIGPTATALNRQRYGINIDATTSSFTITGNDTTGNVTGGINNGTSLSTSKILTANVGAVGDSYLDVAGITGGQTINCGTAAGEDCTFHSTSNATRGQFFMGPLTIDENASRVGIGWTSPDVPLAVSANAASLPAATLSGTTMLHTSAADGNGTRLLTDAFAATPSIDFRRAGTTAASPSAVQLNDNLGQITWSGRGSTVYPSSARASFSCSAAETWTDSAQGTKCSINTTLVGGTTTFNVLNIDATGHIIPGQSTTTAVACTGTGTSPSAPTLLGKDTAFTVTMNTGTGSPGSTGTCTITFGAAYVTNNPVIVCMPVKGATAWGNGATLQLTTESLTAPVITWTNLVGGTTTALTTSTSYKFSCIVLG